eukprot:TRINITY_DN2166_c0_g1_i1.p1 TRINITY_DN2166_c0_g1~~TRINITY_DN2166_c0_g1_i1.p1  ORF type:complete len:69 (+),score=11.01 TRINITY_DN2166_c0_g1_i1:130-336(+)
MDGYCRSVKQSNCAGERHTKREMKAICVLKIYFAKILFFVIILEHKYTTARMEGKPENVIGISGGGCF